jgi:hypothetical protein
MGYANAKNTECSNVTCLTDYRNRKEAESMSYVTAELPSAVNSDTMLIERACELAIKEELGHITADEQAEYACLINTLVSTNRRDDITSVLDRVLHDIKTDIDEVLLQ